MEVIVLIVIISLLTIVLFLALKKLINNITNDSKEYYFKKVQDYDQKLFDKENALKDLEPNEIKTNNSTNENEKENKNYEIDKGFLDVVNNTDYEKANALKIANRVDEIFQIDEEKVIKDFISNCKYNKNYKIYETLQARFSPNLIYKLKMLNRDGQITAIS